jgi:hypothetical protein
MQGTLLLAVTEIHYTSTFGHVPVFGSFEMTLHAKTFAGHDCQFFDLGSCYFM